ncbi:MAG: hypothetical protein ACFFCS_05765 [Candidatus Hodarchaeota archaeon]
MGKKFSSLSFEAYALKFKRYHPFILKTLLTFYKQDPEFFQSLFRSRKQMVLYLNAVKNAKVNILNTSKISSGRRAPGKRRELCTIYHHFFPRYFQRYFRSKDEMDGFLQAMKVKWPLILEKRKKQKKSSPKSASLVSSTPCFMLANHAVWARGILNKPGRHLGNTFDLTTIEGFVFLLHEICHIFQWFRSPIWALFQYVKALVKSISLSDGHILWAHEVIDFEMEAIVFHKKLWLYLDEHPEASKLLDAFRKYQ